MARFNTANYGILQAAKREGEGPSVTIQDLGPWDLYYTVTNAADKVVAELTAKGAIKDGIRLFYYDSEGDLDEILHEGGKFKGFAPGRRS